MRRDPHTKIDQPCPPRQANERFNLRPMQSWSECSPAGITYNVTELAGGLKHMNTQMIINVNVYCYLKPQWMLTIALLQKII